ncbi:MAG: hypothetical protein KHZ62_06165 [Clostridiales bacterium]|nr:hypothetical protein [Clostridiales bacterium]
MTISEVATLLSARFLTGEPEINFQCLFACSSDLMSDVLAFSKDKSILLTGLVNIQVVRTAEIMDMKAVIFVRGKEPSKEVLNYAKEKDITVLATELALFEASGMLYSHGLGRKERLCGCTMT